MPPMPDTDLYDDAPMADEKPMGGEDKEKGGETTALLPKSILAGKKFDVGDEVILKIVAMHDEEIEVEYSYEEPHKEGMDHSDKGEEMASMKEGSDNPGGLYD